MAPTFCLTLSGLMKTGKPPLVFASSRKNLASNWRYRMSQDVVFYASALLALTCALVGGLTALFDFSPVREIRLWSCLLIFCSSAFAFFSVRRKRFVFAVTLLMTSLYLAVGTGAIGTQTGLRAPSLMLLSMFGLLLAFAFPWRQALFTIACNMLFLTAIYLLEIKQVIDPIANIAALNSHSLFIILFIATTMFAAMGFPLGRQVDKAVNKLRSSNDRLALSKERYRSLVEDAPIGILNFDGDLKVTYINQLVADWLGVTPAACSGMALQQFIQRELPVGFLESPRAVLRFDIEVNAQQATGTHRWLSVTVSHFQQLATSVRGGVVLFLDETDRVHASKDLLAAKEAAEAANHAKSKFLSLMSHELRTPMSGILGSLTLAQDARLSPERRSHMLTLLSKSAHSMLGLLDDILDTARISAGKVRIQSQPFSPEGLVHDTAELFRPAAMGKNLKFQAIWQGPHSLKCQGDALRLRQIISNLVSNAIKFTDVGSITLLAEVSELSASQVCLRFSVSDTGIGMTQEQASQLFQPFTEFGLKRAENQKGAGLGLSICKSLIELMGGKIGFSSEAGAGSLFSFELALPVVLESAEGLDDAVPKKVDQCLKSFHVLLAEDNTQNAQLISELLMLEGVMVEVAENGQVALDIIKAHPQKFDAILMDLRMPVMNGFEAAAQIRQFEKSQHSKPIPILALTANVFEADKEEAFASGMNAFLNKPLDVEKLLKALQHYASVT